MCCGARTSFYTSKIYTEQYNVLQNAQDIEVDRIRIRICDIDSVAVEALKKYTTLVIEIKDDPRLEQQLLFKIFKITLTEKPLYRRLLTINKNYLFRLL